ncbi:nucleotidyltransferase family protein [Nitrosomonas sp.]|uniref:nucleotidyltransferase family protein n=1 Tax=Nitrosomonas sp. TaxID=42353 RepID=UPI002731AA69|nr:nucleotidyltransferase family protein [Nitrosomonas sp.]MDP1933856.1 nucleotidyltransferase family protein [Nitrosomonas sp.]MDP2225560.1 nucleotidyltransferase family protein [Nitrosomonas sp.]
MTDESYSSPQRFAALVLAADRTNKDPITQHTGAACKAFAPVDGIPMVIRVLDTLAACDLITTVILCGPPESLHMHCPELKLRIASGQVTWIPNLDSPSRSAESGLSQIPSDTPVLLTTADHALLTPDMVQSFLRSSLAIQGDATVGLVRQQDIAAAFPGSKRTVIRLRDGGFCGCNLFTFNPQGRALIRFWRQAEDLRKRPWRLIAQVLGFKMVLSYLFGFLTLQKGLQAVSEKSGVKIQGIMLDDPRAGVDVDKVEDLVLAESILKKKPHSFPSNTQSIE